jgi:hypothetical protein
MKEIMVREIGHSVFVDERNERVGSPQQLVNNCPMSLAECQAEEHMLLAFQYMKTPNEKLL